MNSLSQFDENDNKLKLNNTDDEQLLLILDSSLTECLFRYLKSRRDIKYETVKLPAFLYTNEETQEQEPATVRSKNINGFKSAIDDLKKEYPGEKFYFYKCYLSEGQFYVAFAHLPIHTHTCKEFL